MLVAILDTLLIRPPIVPPIAAPRLTQSVTLHAPSPPGLFARLIRFSIGIGMPIAAMRCRFHLRDSCRQGFSPAPRPPLVCVPLVFTLGSFIQVGGIHARGNVACVAQHLPSHRPSSVANEPRDMGCAATSPIHIELAVTASLLGPNPVPAPAGFFDPRPESRFDWLWIMLAHCAVPRSPAASIPR